VGDENYRPTRRTTDMPVGTDYPLLCNVWHAHPPILTGPPDIAGQICRLVQAYQDWTWEQLTGTLFPAPRYLYFPAGVDIRCIPHGGIGDTIEVPAGGGTYYTVSDVQDMAKGEANETRRAMMILDIINYPMA
jgi:hypothetical protein